MAYDVRNNRFTAGSSEKKGFFASSGPLKKRTTGGSSMSSGRWRSAGDAYASPARWTPSGEPKGPGLLSRLLGAFSMGKGDSSASPSVRNSSSFRNVKVEPTVAFRSSRQDSVPSFRDYRTASAVPRSVSQPVSRSSSQPVSRSLFQPVSKGPSEPWFRRTGPDQAEAVKLSCVVSPLGASEKPTAPGGFYRPPTAERRSWSPRGSSDPKDRKRWVPQAFLSAQARWWAVKMGFLAILVAVSVALHGRVVEGLQDLAGFHLSQVKVTGTHYLSQEDVIAASGLKPGEGMFRLDLKTAAAGVEALPWVKRVTFERRLPQNILIAVEERIPAALVDAGSVWGVDEEGRLLPPAQELLNEDLPLLSGLQVTAEDAGNTRAAMKLKPALDFLAFLKKEDPSLYADVSEVNAARSEDLRLTFLDGNIARFDSSAGEVELRHMAAVLSDLAAKHRQASLMDFRFKDQVVVRLR